VPSFSDPLSPSLSPPFPPLSGPHSLAPLCRQEAGQGCPGHADLYLHRGGSKVFLALADASHVAAPDCFLWTRAFFQGATPARYSRVLGWCTVPYLRVQYVPCPLPPAPVLALRLSPACYSPPVRALPFAICICPSPVPFACLLLSSSLPESTFSGPCPQGPSTPQLRIATGQEDVAGAVFRLCTAAHQVRTLCYAVARCKS